MESPGAPHYEIEEKIGEGGMGVVYRALDRKLNRQVALKFLPADLTASPEGRERARREALAISALNHPHIETIYDLDEVDGRLCLVLEYLPGGTLREKLEVARAAGLRLPIGEIVRYAVETAGGLAHAHSRGIVHRDVKTSNLLLTREGMVKITDFGLAKWRAADPRSQEGTLMGTLGYLSPELARGIAADERSDVFSFGVVLFELVAGSMPFRGANEADLLLRLLHEPAPPVRRFRGDAPPAMEQIIAKALEKRREDRYQRMEDLLADLQALQSRLLDRTLDGTEASTASQEVVAPGPTRRSWLGRSVLAILLLAALAAAASFLWRPFRDWVQRPQIPAERKLAVLPFRNLGGADVSQTFCDGLMDILTNKLTQLEQVRGPLRVFAASDVLNLRVGSAGEARRALGANLALAVSVHRDGEKTILAASLVDTESQLQLAATTVEARSRDLPSLQENLVRAVADMLRVPLLPEVQQAIAAGRTQVPTAYEDYVLGRGELQRSDRPERVLRAIALFQRALDLDPLYALAHAGMAEADFYQYQLTKDRRYLEEARKNGSRSIELDPRLAPAHASMGLIQTASGQYDEAVKSFEQALKLDPLSLEAQRGLAAAYEAQQKMKQAEAAYQRAIELRPASWVVHRDLGAFYYRRSQYEKAIPSFGKVIELTPDNYRGYNNLGGVYMKLSRRAEAARMFERSLQIQPSANTYSNLGTLRYFERRFADAAANFEKAAALTPKDSRLWGNLAMAYQWTPELNGKAPEAFRRAIALSEESLAANPKNAPVRASLATYLAFSGQIQRALSEMEAALRVAPEDSAVLFRAAEVCEHSGLRDRAIEYLGRALERGQSLEEVRGTPLLTDLRKDPRYQRMEIARTRQP
jgi:tetratricopeptide (TPR) repeat protein